MSGMSINDFANVGVFVIASVGFGLVTGLFGVLINPDDSVHSPLVSWLVGILVYGMTVMFMWRWWQNECVNTRHGNAVEL